MPDWIEPLSPEAKHFVAGLRARDRNALEDLADMLQAHDGAHVPTCEALGISRQCLSDLGRQVPEVRKILKRYGRKPGRPRKVLTSAAV